MRHPWRSAPNGQPSHEDPASCRVRHPQQARSLLPKRRRTWYESGSVEVLRKDPERKPTRLRLGLESTLRLGLESTRWSRPGWLRLDRTVDQLEVVLSRDR